MFNKNFYPTADSTIDMMIHGIDLKNKNVLDPQGGKGNIVDYVKNLNVAKNVQAIEIEPELRNILDKKCEVIGNDFLQTTTEQISHIDVILMNPPFDNGLKHIIHAWNIAPEGCTIVSLFNAENLERTRVTHHTSQVQALIKDNGVYVELGKVFTKSERTTNVSVGMVTLFKPIVSADYDFDGYFTEEEELEEGGESGIMSYNVVRDVVQRYIGTMKLFDEFKKISTQIGNYIEPIGFSGKVDISLGYDEVIQTKEQFSKTIQKKSWKWIINKMNVDKFVTSGVMDDIHKFVENQTKYPFTMKNVYRMIDMIIQTRSQTMDKSVIEIFDEITKHYHENRYMIEGWKTNSHYLIGEKFILPYVTEFDKRWDGDILKIAYNGNSKKLDDLHKVMMYITGERFEKLSGYVSTDIRKIGKVEDEHGNWVQKDEPAQFGNWYEWGFFEIKGFKKGTMHVKFKNRDHWALLNRKIAEIKGFPLPEKL